VFKNTHSFQYVPVLTPIFNSPHRNYSVNIRYQSSNFLQNHNTVSELFIQKRFCQTASGSSETIKVPGMGDSITEGKILEFSKKVGEACLVNDVIVSIETDKIHFQVRAPKNGVVTKTLVNVGDDVRVGQDLLIFEARDVSSTTKSKDQSAPPPKDQPTKATPDSVDTPKRPQAPSKESQTAATSKEPPAAASKEPPAAASKEYPPPPEVKIGSREERRVKMTKIRQRIAARLKESQNTAAMLTTFQEIDMHNLIELRNKFKDAFEKKHNVKLGFMSAFVKASSIALKDNPIANATIDGDSIVYRDYHDISVAVATPNGLIVPVLRNVETMNFATIEKNY
jgi:2-oxoglutarate dehydrogenase E2 component (dihydrolipoamide succinyltransferase)